MKRKALLVAAALLLSLFGAEAALRFLPGSVRDFWFPKNMYRIDPDPAIAYRLSPTVDASVHTPKFHYRVTTDRRGFRGPEPDPDPNRPLVALFGDSFAFGQGVDDDETFAAVAARALPETRWLNAGVYGYRPSQEYATYRRLVAETAIDTVVLQLCSNDVEDQTAPIARAVHRGYLNPNPPTDLWGELTNGLLLNSELAARGHAAYHALRSIWRPRPDFLAPDFESRRAREIATTEALLARWFDDTAHRGQAMVVLYIPHEAQLDPAAIPQAARWRAEPGGIDPDAVQRWLGRFLERHPDIVYLDFAPILREQSAHARAKLYIPGDGHLDALGNALVGEHLAAALRPSSAQRPRSELAEREP